MAVCWSLSCCDVKPTLRQYRFSAVRQAGCSRGQAVLSERIAFPEPPYATGVHCGLPANGAVLEQHRGTGPSSDQAASASEPSGFDPLGGAWRTIQGYEAMLAIGQAQARRIGVGQVARRLDFIARRSPSVLKPDLLPSDLFPCGGSVSRCRLWKSREHPAMLIANSIA
jgi:hypothetical protein